MNTFAEIEALLKSALVLSQNSVKQIAAASDIKASRLYKWKTSDDHLSPQKADALLLYFIENEPQTIVEALVLNAVLIELQDLLPSLFDKEVEKGE